jgi:hypothetical protein
MGTSFFLGRLREDKEVKACAKSVDVPPVSAAEK